MHGLADVIRGIVHNPKPVIAAVEGAAFGAGLSLAAACDHVIASRSARFCCSFGAVGLTADAGLHWSLPARVGYGRARTMIMFGEVIEPEIAHTWGLVDTLTSVGASAQEAGRLAKLVRERVAPMSLAMSKRLLGERAAALDTVLAHEAAAQLELLASEDFAEGRAAFFEARKPRFRGR